MIREMFTGVHWSTQQEPQTHREKQLRQTTAKNNSSQIQRLDTQKTRGIHLMSIQCWASVKNGGPTLKRHVVNASSFMEYSQSEPESDQKNSN